MSNPTDLAKTTGRQFFQRNKVAAVEIITPKMYLEDDIAISGLTTNPLETILNSHIIVAENASDIIGATSSTTFPNADNISGISQFFVKQNNLTNISPFLFERDILAPEGKSFSDFDTSAEFHNYLSGNLLPSSVLNSPTGSLTHDQLLQRLGWMYLLNASGTPYSPSSYVLDTLDTLYFGSSIDTLDGVNGLTELLWRNYTTCTVLQDLGSVPTNFLSGTGTYTSGTQQLDKLKTLNGVLYSRKPIDAEDTLVEDSFEDYIGASVLLSAVESAGPMFRFLKALSYATHDVDDEIETLGLLYNIERCPEKFLPEIASIIGWRLMGHEPTRWRLQLRNAVKIYKAKGTKSAIQLAADSLFADSTFALSSNITELHESYIPYLLYYALNTGTTLFSSTASWTQDKANALGVSGYTTSNMDVNIRYVVDYILYKAATKFPELFFIGKEPFRVGDPDFIFSYRGNINQTPPWEGFKFYKDCMVSQELLDFLQNELACFGVASNLAAGINSYISRFTVDSTEDLYLNNQFLFFTSSLEKPTNYNEVLQDYSSNKSTFLSLWNGKSSHFDLTLSSASFNFAPLSLAADSSLALVEAIRAMEQFIPAHAIPLTNLLIGDKDEYGYEDVYCPRIVPYQNDCWDASTFNPGYEISGVSMRDGDGSAIFTRQEADGLEDSLVVGAGISTGVARNSIRRRGLNTILPKNGVFFRDGFSMPSQLMTTTSGNANPSGYAPLGYIPSAGVYQGIDDYRNIPAVYDRCENLSSSSTFYGIPTSATYPVRGQTNISPSSCHEYSTRGEAPEIFEVIFNTLQERARANASGSLTEVTFASSYAPSAFYRDTSASLANTSAGPNSYDDWINFQFGRGVHQVYRDYHEFMGSHATHPGVLVSGGGKNIFAHTYGPLLFNGDLRDDGVSSNLVTSALGSKILLQSNSGSGVFSNSGITNAGTYGASDAATWGNVQESEFRNASIFSGVELVYTSGSSESNNFIAYRLDKSLAQPKASNYTIDNGIIEQRSVDGLGRIRFDLSATDASNVFIPEHTFELTVGAFISKDNAQQIGGGTVGVWIHTHPENGYVWSYTPNRKWEIHEASALSQGQVINSLSHNLAIPLTQPTASDAGAACVVDVNEDISQYSVNALPKEYFSKLKVQFDTLNYRIDVPEYYFRNVPQVHNPDQRYVIEVFKTPNLDKKQYALFDEVSIIDLTEAERAKEYSAEYLRRIIRFFNDSSNAKASRVVANTEDTFEVSGGSRLNYNLRPDWREHTKDSTFGNFTSVDLLN